jgi:hypothetical protein
MLDALNFDNGLIWRRFQHAIVAATGGMISIHHTTQCSSPEAGSLINIRRAAINQNGAKAGIVHGNLLSPG